MKSNFASVRGIWVQSLRRVTLLTYGYSAVSEHWRTLSNLIPVLKFSWTKHSYNKHTLGVSYPENLLPEVWKTCQNSARHNACGFMQILDHFGRRRRFGEKDVQVRVMFRPVLVLSSLVFVFESVKFIGLAISRPSQTGWPQPKHVTLVILEKAVIHSSSRLAERGTSSKP